MDYNTQMNQSIDNIKKVLSSQDYKTLTEDQKLKLIRAVLAKQARSTETETILLSSMAFFYGADSIYCLIEALKAIGEDHSIIARALGSIHDSLEECEVKFKSTPRGPKPWEQ